MNARPRRSLIVLAITTALVLMAVAVAWHFSEERRLARVVARALAGRTGLPITIERAALHGTALKLFGVRMAATSGVPLEIRAQEIDVAGGLLPVLAPAGRRLSVTAVSASVIVPDGGSPPNAMALQALGPVLQRVLDWPGELTLRVEGSELRRAGRVDPLALTADKTGDALTLTVALGPDGRALAADVRGTKGDGGSVRLGLDVQSAPRQLVGPWPAWLPGADALALRADLQLLPGQVLTTGRATLTAKSRPAGAEFSARYDTASGALAVSRYVLDWDRDLHLEGQAAITADGRISGTVRGAVAGSPVDGRGTYEGAAGAFTAEVTVAALDLPRAAARLSLSPVPGDLTARRIVARTSGVIGGQRPMAKLDLVAQGVTTPAVRAFPLDATLDTSVVLAPATPAVRPASITSFTLGLARGGRRVATLSGGSRGAALWPLAIEAAVDDLAELTPAWPWPATLTGSARVVGEVLGLDGVAFRGTLEATIPRAEITAGAAVQLTRVQGRVPVAWGVPLDAPAGSLTVERIDGYRLAMNQITSTAHLADGRLMLPDIAYTQYGGRGQGWLDATLGASTPFRTHLEARGVDLARLIAESGSQVAQVSGIVRYVAAAQQTAADGFSALIRLESERGGEVSVDAIEQLVSSAAVQEDSSGVLRQTLENLRVFPYESLEGELRLTGGDGRLDLSLRGKKRLGIFRPPVEAINLRNVPLAVLARTFSRESTP